MGTDVKGAPLYQEESEAIIGCAIEVHSGLGYGFHGKPYENALVVELKDRGIPCGQPTRFEMRYKDREVGEYIPVENHPHASGLHHQFQKPEAGVEAGDPVTSPISAHQCNQWLNK